MVIHSSSVGGVKVSMVAFQAVDPGSIPGRRTSFIFFIFFNYYLLFFFIVFLLLHVFVYVFYFFYFF